MDTIPANTTEPSNIPAPKKNTRKIVLNILLVLVIIIIAYFYSVIIYGMGIYKGAMTAFQKDEEKILTLQDTIKKQKAWIYYGSKNIQDLNNEINTMNAEKTASPASNKK